MYKIYCLETKKFEPDLFLTYEEAVEMMGHFILDDKESSPPLNYSYGAVDSSGNMLCVLKGDTYIDLRNISCKIK